MAKLFKNLDYDNDSVLVPSDLDGYATEAYISEELADYATKDDLVGEDGYITSLDNRISGLENGIANLATKDDIRGFVTRSDVEEMISDMPTPGGVEDLSLSISDMSVSMSDFSYSLKRMKVGDGRITFTRNNIQIGSFGVNQTQWSWIDIEVPTDVRDLTDDDSRFVTSVDLSRKIASLERAMDSVGGGAAAAATSAYEAASNGAWAAWSQLRSETSANLDTVNSDIGTLNVEGQAFQEALYSISEAGRATEQRWLESFWGLSTIGLNNMFSISAIANQLTAFGSGLTAIEWERSVLLEQGWILHDDGTVSPVPQGTTFGELIALGGGVVFRNAPTPPLAG